MLKYCSTIFLIMIIIVSRTAYAAEANISLKLGNILGSEEFCGLLFDQAAIQTFVEKNVSDNDMEFISELETMIRGTIAENQNMSSSSKTARCTQVRRVAKSYGFIH